MRAKRCKKRSCSITGPLFFVVLVNMAHWEFKQGEVNTTDWGAKKRLWEVPEAALALDEDA